jgi:hypothetical protein
MENKQLKITDKLIIHRLNVLNYEKENELWQRNQQLRSKT